MSSVVNNGYTDTAISGVTALGLDRGLINFKADFVVQKNAITDVTLVNMSSPLDRPEKFRFAVNDIANIYTNTGIDPSVWAASTKGESLLCQVTEVLSVTDTTDPSYRVDLPITCNITLKFPKNALITSTQLQTLLGRAVSGFYETGDLTTAGINRLSHGSLIPTDL